MTEFSVTYHHEEGSTIKTFVNETRAREWLHFSMAFDPPRWLGDMLDLCDPDELLIERWRADPGGDTVWRKVEIPSSV